MSQAAREEAQTTLGQLMTQLLAVRHKSQPAWAPHMMAAAPHTTEAEEQRMTDSLEWRLDFFLGCRMTLSCDCYQQVAARGQRSKPGSAILRLGPGAKRSGSHQTECRDTAGSGGCYSAHCLPRRCSPHGALSVECMQSRKASNWVWNAVVADSWQANGHAYSLLGARAFERSAMGYRASGWSETATASEVAPAACPRKGKLVATIASTAAPVSAQEKRVFRPPAAREHCHAGGPVPSCEARDEMRSCSCSCFCCDCLSCARAEQSQDSSVPAAMTQKMAETAAI